MSSPEYHKKPPKRIAQTIAVRALRDIAETADERNSADDACVRFLITCLAHKALNEMKEEVAS